jgi:hypothetical protein
MTTRSLGQTFRNGVFTPYTSEVVLPLECPDFSGNRRVRDAAAGVPKEQNALAGATYRLKSSAPSAAMWP